MDTKRRLSVLFAAVWWGSLTGLCFVVVPMLFTHMPTTSSAGAMAAKLFGAQTWLSIACAMLMLLIYVKKDHVAPAAYAQAAMKYIVAGFLLALLVEFGVSPRIVSARADGGNLRLWHGVGSAMYLAQWLCAGLALWSVSSATQAPAENSA